MCYLPGASDRYCNSRSAILGIYWARIPQKIGTGITGYFEGWVQVYHTESVMVFYLQSLKMKELANLWIR